jgi:hypothetical protein
VISWLLTAAPAMISWRNEDDQVIRDQDFWRLRVLKAMPKFGGNESRVISLVIDM